VSQASYKLRVAQLRKTYGAVVALEAATLELREGEFLTLLGPSGSGKTTLLMIIAGLVPPDSGDVWIDERLATFAPPFRRDIGMVFQNYALFPHLTVFENIAFPLRMRRLPEAVISTEVQRALAVVGLPEMGPRLPRMLSGGQQQRVALARCLVYRPSIVLMDEPLGALDKKLRDRMQLEIKQLATELGITVLYVTHDQEEATVMSDRICLMNEGRIEQIGSPAELYFEPRTAFAATFLGESNLFEATVIGAEGAHVALATTLGSDVRALSRTHLRPGDKVVVMVRPERLSLLEPGDTAVNTLTGTLRDRVLVGALTKNYVLLDDGQVVTATELTRGPSRAVATTGSRVRLGWAPDGGVLLPAPLDERPEARIDGGGEA
jgi:putative spermidine/putrescine transport system ATP-binding protein